MTACVEKSTRGERSERTALAPAGPLQKMVPQAAGINPESE
ncbi:MAG: hypothetical protein SVV67_06455 [Bacillota bacterium]|nr:hypothetical protein [Bacillota bacterium]